MSKKRKLSNMKERCRICLVKQGCMTNLFEKSVFAKITDLILSTAVKIENDAALPNIICHVCLYKLDMWDEFKKQFKQSHRLLTNHLGIAKSIESTAKRTHSDIQGTTDDSLSDTSMQKKVKAGTHSVEQECINLDSTDTDSKVQEIYVSDNDPTSSKESAQRVNEDPNGPAACSKAPVKIGNNATEEKPSLIPMKIKNLTGKRGKTNESRKASTKRWVARKKALLAATGKSASDSDSMGSDDGELSPVQKARVRNIIDKESMRQKRVARELKKLGATLSEKYIAKYDSDNFGCADSESDVRKTRSKSDLNTKERSARGKADAKENIVSSDTMAHDKNSLPAENDTTEPSEMQSNEKTFTPHLVRSELELGNATYVITSTLVLSEPHYLCENNLTNLTKELRSSISAQNTQEKNTDIIDAVQLRRVNPITNDSSDKSNTERCLNIDIEGTELEALKSVQMELARFVDKEMKQRLCGLNVTVMQSEKSKSISQTSYQTLDQQLKNIVEKAIKKNFESSMAKCSANDVDMECEISRAVSPSSAKAAEKCKKYQPQVLVKRLDVMHESKYCKINNAYAANQRGTTRNSIDAPTSTALQKRQTLLPINYNDYNTSTMDSGDSNVSPEVLECETPIPESRSNVEVRDAIAQKQPHLTNNPTEKTKSIETIQNPMSSTEKEEVRDSEDASNTISPGIQETHVCGVCGKAFSTREDVTKHFRTHKIDSASTRHNKHKVMRCKRCHEIVEARFVKAHVCKQIHKCYVCNSTFRTEKLLVRHLESHDQSEFSIENITKGQCKKPVVPMDTEAAETPARLTKIFDSLEHSNNSDSNSINNVQTEKVISNKSSRPDGPTNTDTMKETYVCFVCDKVFTDEEELKDHLQKHCDDISESEQSKEQYQCAICGDSMSSEDALEAHVEKHLFDEEDDNPNLISIGSENEKSNVSEGYHCLQCAETFNSEMLLEMHMQAHEEEAAIAEWEKQGVKSYEYRCTICDELFDAEEDLSEHLDIHNRNGHACQLCDKPFTTLEDLQKHVATH